MFKARTPPKTNSFMNLGAPVRGFKTSLNLMNMAAQDAVILENFFPRPDAIETRDGYVDHITAIPLQADRLHVYGGVSGSESLWGTTAGGIYNFTVAGACPAASLVLTSGLCVSTAISTGAGNYMLMVNGTDSMSQYDGTTWTAVGVLGAVNTNTFSYIETYRQRIFLVTKNSTQINYLAANAIAGAPTAYPLGALFRQGGYIVAMSTWTIDGGVGPEDHLAVMTNKGEVAVFAGNDPATWALRGVYFAGRPLGLTPMYKYGGDVLMITETGIVTCSSLVQTASIDRTQKITQYIQQDIIDNAQNYSANQGWQVISDPIKPMVLVNIPSSPQITQRIQHAQTGAWATYTGWNAIYFARMAGQMYFSAQGTAGTYTVKRVTGSSDNGSNVTATMLQAFNSFGMGGQKKVELIRPYFESSVNYTYNVGFANDFQVAKNFNQVNVSTGLSAAVWGTSLWGTAVWTGSESTTYDWQTPVDEYSTWKALYVQVVARLAQVSYIGSDLLFTRGGHF